MFVKYGDNTEPLSIEVIGKICDECNESIKIIDGKKICSCKKNNTNLKINKILTQDLKMANFNKISE